ncbi:integrase catalytic domain-containing protein [Nephila pilipes]|uniref:Integrase catalytic domain-containing protein n=1 Tax=Nephila pilipes TaxID=299642 RepID=A0A8X6PVM7_NEPPI|nr:integrase catalytic domain-containing protein [Nephila pilipes]
MFRFGVTDNFRKLFRVISFIFRFCKNAKSCVEQVIGLLSLKELEETELWLLQSVQRLEFFEAVKHLKKGEPVNRNCKLASLNCFMDNNNIIRIGERLRNSSLSFHEKYPIVHTNCNTNEIIHTVDYCQAITLTIRRWERSNEINVYLGKSGIGQGKGTDWCFSVPMDLGYLASLTRFNPCFNISPNIWPHKTLSYHFGRGSNSRM